MCENMVSDKGATRGREAGIAALFMKMNIEKKKKKENGKILKEVWEGAGIFGNTGGMGQCGLCSWVVMINQAASGMDECMRGCVWNLHIADPSRVVRSMDGLCEVQEWRTCREKRRGRKRDIYQNRHHHSVTSSPPHQMDPVTLAVCASASETRHRAPLHSSIHLRHSHTA